MPDLSFDAAIAFARDLIRIPSPPGAEGAVADRVLAEFERLGFDEVSRDAAGNVIGRIRGSGKGATVLLNAHLDIVAEGDPAEWEHPPFEGVLADGFLHGRGAMDIKGPLALMTYAAAVTGGRLPGDVVVAHTVFEERGGLGMKHLLEAGEVRPDVVIIGESTHGDLCIGHRGRAEVEVVLRGTAGHASAPERAHNAIDLLPRVLEALAEVSADQPSDDLLGPATMAVTGIDVSPGSRNVIPDTVVLALDWRVLPGTTSDDLVARVRDALDRRLPILPEGHAVEVRMALEEQVTYTGLEHDRNLLTPGFLVAPDHPIAVAGAAAIGRREGEGAAAIRPWTFATDGGWSCGVNGIPTVGFAPGEERHAHTNRERLDLDEARWAYGRYPALIEAVMTAAGSARGSA
ncbi:M20 family metallopeptidase [Gaopeijia maritima]|uniref:M20/M25/M40 family metallo-hydrolase n=1 Tax=Gaopeijia maritima TaxID=3119007 RepID=A0ABU9ECM8_9BACT